MTNNGFSILVGLFFFFQIGCSSTDSLVKNEFERPIQRADFPQKAIELISAHFPASIEIRFFQEYDGVENTFEAKLEYEDQSFSIEVDTLGNLQDIELLIEFEDISPFMKEGIDTYLDNYYSSYRITRTQYQYSSDSIPDNEVLRGVLAGSLNGTTFRIEIELEGKNRRELGYFEYLFDSNGDVLQRRRINKRSIDNIW